MTRIALAQLDVRAGDVAANGARAHEAIADAEAAAVDLVVFPELFLSGYCSTGTAVPAEEAAAFAGDAAAVVVGFHELAAGRHWNSAVYVEAGSILHVQRKVHLVAYPPFGEDRIFESGDDVHAFDAAVGRVAVLVCNDAWQPWVPARAAQDGVQILLVPAASSTAMPDIESYWRDLSRFYARMLSCFVVFVNRVGTENGFAFWGGSHVVDPLGRVVARAPRNEEAVVVADLDVSAVEARRREWPLLAPPRDTDRTP